MRGKIIFIVIAFVIFVMSISVITEACDVKRGLTMFIKNIFSYIEFNQIEPLEVTDEIMQKLTGRDLSNNNLKNKREILFTSDFDTKTKWPTKDKLPEGFDPEKIMEWGKNPGLGLKKLHQQGYTGRGVNIAVIDARINKKHIEIRDNLKYYEEVDDITKMGYSFHGTAVSSIALGKEIGVAPEANLYYFVIKDESDYGKYQANVVEAIDRIIGYNKTVDITEKVRIVVSALGYNKKTEEGRMYLNAINRAAEKGIMVIQPLFNVQAGTALKFYLMGAVCNNPLDRDNLDNYSAAYWADYFERRIVILKEAAKSANVLEEMESKINNLITNLQEKNDIWFAYILEEANKSVKNNFSDIHELRNYLEETENYHNTKAIYIPSDSTVQASYKGKREYMYSGVGGSSWIVPYYGGILALALQVNPKLTNEELIELVDNSCVINQHGIRIISPEKLIDLALSSRNNEL